MREDTVVQLRQPGAFSEDPLTKVLRLGARLLLAQAVEMFAQFIAVPMYNRAWINGPKRNAAISEKSDTWRVLEIGCEKKAVKAVIKSNNTDNSCISLYPKPVSARYKNYETNPFAPFNC